MASAHRAGLGSAPGSSAWKIGSSGLGAEEDAVALDDPKDDHESCAVSGRKMSRKAEQWEQMLSVEERVPRRDAVAIELEDD